MIEKLAPEIPKFKQRLSECEQQQWEFKSFYSEICLKDELNAILL